jgi:cyclophilin family peptidyl-prolyl cis-trans isomerase
MTGLVHILVTIVACFLGQSMPSTGDVRPAEPPSLVVDAGLVNSVRAELRAPKTVIPVGSPVVIEFSLQNITDEPVRLTVPGALVGKERVDLGMGLPLQHVYSGVGFRGLDVMTESNPTMGERITRKPEYPEPPVTLAPFATIGLRFDVSRFYPGLHQSGTFQLTWRPYGGVLNSNTVTIQVVQYKQVNIETDMGSMTIQLLYDKAPKHVANFLELVEKRFYNGKNFHIVYPNQFILGGCPVGDGTGKRADGVTLTPEFNDTAFELGTVGMALIEGDPNSASSQFFICLSRQPAWDGRYTAFGQIVGPQSVATLRRLGQVELDENHRPRKPLTIKSMSSMDAVFTPRAAQP